MEPQANPSVILKEDRCPICRSPRPATSIQTTAEMEGGELEYIYKDIYDQLCEEHKRSVETALSRRTSL